MNTQNCPIWGNSCQVHSGHFDGYTVFNKRVGYSKAGSTPSYKITRSAIANLKTVPNILVAQRMLTNWIVSQHLSGEETPTITTDIISACERYRPISFNERKVRFFRYLHDKMIDIGDLMDLEESECEELYPLLDLLEFEHVLNFYLLLVDLDILKNRGHGQFTIGPQGLGFLEGRDTQSKSVFIAMWFDESTDEAFKAIEAAIENDCKLVAMRIDRKPHNNKICDEIIAEIRRSRFVVADFTCGLVDADKRKEALVRGGVYYEAGFAQGLGKQVIWTCQTSLVNHLHFDTRQYAHLLWDNPSELRKALAIKIKALGLDR